MSVLIRYQLSADDKCPKRVSPWVNLDRTDRPGNSKSPRRSENLKPSQLLLSAVLEDLFRQVVLDFSLIPHHFVVGRPQQLGAAIAQLLANILLHPRVVQLTLAGWLLLV